MVRRNAVFCACCALTATALAGTAGTQPAAAGSRAMTPLDVARLQFVASVDLSPDGTQVAYTVRVHRDIGTEPDGPAWIRLHVVDSSGRARPFVAGEVSVGAVAWRPDGKALSFIAKRAGDEHDTLYAIAADGGEAQRIVKHDADVTRYAWRPDGGALAFIAEAPLSAAEKQCRDAGFTQKVYEEDWRPRRLYIVEITPEGRVSHPCTPHEIKLPGSAVDVTWAPTGMQIAVAVAPSPQIDDEMMCSAIHVVDAARGVLRAKVDHAAKLGKFRFGPDGQHLALIAGADLHDPQEGRLLIAPVTGGKPRDLLPDYLGHVQDFAWADAQTVVYLGHEGCESAVRDVNIETGATQTHVPPGGPVLTSISLSTSLDSGAAVASTPGHPPEVFYMRSGVDDAPRRLTDSNPWLAEVQLGRQEVVRFKARDGLELEGLLIYPLGYATGRRYPLVMMVHGGPEAHESNGWLTGYAAPTQVLAARGFAVFFPNYRGSTGRGVAFSKLGQVDYAGKEFDDLVDAKRHLVQTGLVDEDKVGITGGSYGGYAAAWAATKLSDHFAAAVMQIGLSDLVSMFGTTDIPKEWYLVHARQHVWEDWNFFAERSPLRYVEQAHTPILIAHGEADPRVSYTQSVMLYRYLKSLGRAPVRLVLYPGEPHGNRRAAARYDYQLRLIQWFEHYLLGPGGPPPAYELDYGLPRVEEARPAVRDT